MTPSQEDMDRWASEGGYIGKDGLLNQPGVTASREPADEADLLEKMRQGIKALSDEDQVAERIRKLEAIRNEHEVQERARAYRQVERGPASVCPHCGGALVAPMFEVG